MSASTVDAWLIEAFGEPRDVLRRGSTAPPALGTGDVRVAVEAVGLNFLDVSMCRGDYVSRPPLPLVPGAELAGRVLEVGSDVDGVTVGARVAAMSPIAQGGFAAETVVPVSAVQPVPETMSAAHAASILVTYQTAYVSLIRRARLVAGEWLLVHAGAGGVGTAAIQLARAHGARVIATAGSEEKRAVCAEEGAEVVLDYRRDDLVDAVLAATDGRGVDLVLDPVGGETFARSLECSALEARLIPIGWASGERPHLDPEALLVRNVDIIGVSWGSRYPLARPDVVRETHAALLALYSDGRIAPRVEHVWGIDELPDAVQALADGRVIGKAVVAR